VCSSDLPAATAIPGGFFGLRSFLFQHPGIAEIGGVVGFGPALVAVDNRFYLVEGDLLELAVFFELADPDLLNTLRFRAALLAHRMLLFHKGSRHRFVDSMPKGSVKGRKFLAVAALSGRLRFGLDFPAQNIKMQ
jgi:hypothetical protein